MSLRVSLICDDDSLEIPANPYPMYPTAERLDYISVDTAGGNQFVVNAGKTRVVASIVWKSIPYDIAIKYEHFLLNVIELGLKSFKIECPSYIDLGLGKGTDIFGAHYNGPANLGGIIKPREGDAMYFDIELPYTFVRDYES